MACGKPCVVTVAGDSTLVVQNSGVVVPTEDPVLLASGISAMLDRLSGIDPLKLLRKISESFTIEKMVDGTEKALQDVFDGR
jgi:glycosyltransferase involved in cell wall biosynthesis